MKDKVTLFGKELKWQAPLHNYSSTSPKYHSAGIITANSYQVYLLHRLYNGSLLTISIASDPTLSSLVWSVATIS